MIFLSAKLIRMERYHEDSGMKNSEHLDEKKRKI